MPSQLPPIYRWEIDAPIGAVHVLHGMSDHGRRYAQLAAALNDAGFVVWAHDHRGHGDNPTPPVGLGHFADADGWNHVVDDAWSVSNALRGAWPAVPLVLVAHSMGSFVAQALLPRYGEAYRAVVLTGTDGPAGLDVTLAKSLAVAQRAMLGGRAPGRWLDRAVFGRYNRQFAPNRTDFDWLSRDQRSVDAYIADPLCGVPLTAQSWLDFLSGRFALTTAQQLSRIPKELPIRLMAGSQDPVGGNGAGVRRLAAAYRNAGLRHVSTTFYDDARHELFHESNRTEVFTELVGWLTSLCQPRDQAGTTSR